MQKKKIQKQKKRTKFRIQFALFHSKIILKGKPKEGRVNSGYTSPASDSFDLFQSTLIQSPIIGCYLKKNCTKKRNDKRNKMNGNIFPQPSYQIFLYVKTMEQYHSSPSIVIVTEEDNGVTLPLLQQHIIIAVPCLKQAIDIKKVANSMLFSRGQGKITIRTPSGLFLFFFFQKMLKTLESKHKNLISSQ